MYHKITNSLDCNLFIQYLSTLYHGTGFQELHERLTWTNDFLCTYKVHTEEERGGYILCFPHPIDRESNPYLHKALENYHLSPDIAEYIETVNQSSIQCNADGTTVIFVEELYIITDFHLVIIYPTEGRAEK